MKKYEVINEILLEMDQEGPHWQALGDTVRQLEADRRWQVRRAGIVPGDPAGTRPKDILGEITHLTGKFVAYGPVPYATDQVPADLMPCWHWNGNVLNRLELIGLRDLLRAKGPASEPEPGTAVAAELLIVRLDEIVPNPHQPRRDFDQEQLQALATSITANGLLQFPIVEPLDEFLGGYQLIDGERRWRACALAGLETIPVIVRPPLDDEQRLLLAVESNEQRANLNPVELARALQLLADGGMSNAAIGQRLGGLSAAAISNKRRLLQLPEDVLGLVEAGQLTERQAAALLPLYALPPAVLAKCDTSWQSPAKIIEHAVNGAPSNQVRDMVGRLIVGISGLLDEAMIEIAGDGVEAANCLDCPLSFAHGRDRRCIGYDCRQLKRHLHKMEMLAPAVAASGIAAAAFDERSYYSFYGVRDSEISALMECIAGCANRRLVHNEPTENYPNRVAPAGYEATCKIVCVAGYDCACAASIEQLRQAEVPDEPPPAAWQYRINGTGRVRVIAPTGKSLDLEREQVAGAVRVLWGDATAALLESPDRALLAEARAAILATANRYNMPGTKMIEWYEEGPDSDTWHILAMNVRELPQGIVSQALRELVSELPEEQLRAEAEAEVG